MAAKRSAFHPLVAVLLLALISCRAAARPFSMAPPPTQTPASRATRPSTAQPTEGATATVLAPPATPSATLPVLGPGYVEGFNPLTGLPLEDEATLDQSAVLVAITNFPPSARPQAGLSQAAHVWETSIGQGLTRFLAVYYGDYRERLAKLAVGEDLPYGFVIGPVRSGRVAFETIRGFYPEGLLITRAASPEVLSQLRRQITINTYDPQDVNSAGLRPGDFEDLPYVPVDPSEYGHYRFDPEPPAGGQPGPDLKLIYNRFAHVGWEYDPVSGKYLRFQDRATGQGILAPHHDRLTGEQLAFENVVVLFADHKFENPEATILTIKLTFVVPGRRGLLFRDGRMYDITWTSPRGEFQLLTADGEPLALKPGRTFFEVASFQSSWAPEERLVRYHSPPLPTLTPTEVFTASPTPTDTPTLTPEPAPASETPEATASPGP